MLMLKWSSSVFSFCLRFLPFVSTAHGRPEFCSLATMSRWNCLIYSVQMVISKTGEHSGVSGVPRLIFHMCPSFSDSEFSICLLLISFQNLLSFLWHFGLSSIARVNLHLLILSELNCVEHDKSKCYLVHSICITLTILSSPVNKERTEGKWSKESHIFSLENKRQPYNELAVEGRMGSIKIHMLQTHVPRTPKLMNWERQIGQVRLSDSVVFGLEGWFHC